MKEDSPYLAVCQQIASIAHACGRNPAEITLVAVTKQVDWEAAHALYKLGQRDFGENRLQEAASKQLAAANDCRWHFIGHLQTNKVNKAVGRFVLIHSVDSLLLARRLSLASQERKVVTSILLQANTSGESSKQGLTPEEWKSCFNEVWEFPGINVQGLMTMAPLTDNEATIRECFRNLKILRNELREMTGSPNALPHLSMGMSHDFAIAIQEGATLLRIGSALFT